MGYRFLNVLGYWVARFFAGSHDVCQCSSQVIIIFLKVKDNIKSFYAFVFPNVVVRSFWHLI